MHHLLDELPNDGVKVESGPGVVGVEVGQLCEYKQGPGHPEMTRVQGGSMMHLSLDKQGHPGLAKLNMLKGITVVIKLSGHQ